MPRAYTLVYREFASSGYPKIFYDDDDNDDELKLLYILYTLYIVFNIFGELDARPMDAVRAVL